MTTTTIPTADTMEADRYKAAFVWVDPTIAERWLGRNENNRNLNQALVRRYVTDMEAGDWAFTGEAVKFSASGKLLDGQHRLHAIIKSGVTVLMLVVRGLDDPAQDVMDTGRKRTAHDMLKMHGKTHATALAATARLVVAWQNGAIKTSDTQFVGHITNSQILAVVESDPYVAWASELAAHANGVAANPSAIGLAAWVAGRFHADQVRTFLTTTAEMRTDGPGDPRYTLANRLRIARDQRERLTSIQQAWLILRAFEAYRSGRKLKQLKLSSHVGASAFPSFGPEVDR